MSCATVSQHSAPKTLHVSYGPHQKKLMLKIRDLACAVVLVLTLTLALGAQAPGVAPGCFGGAERIRRGKELHVQGKYSLAIKEFQAAQLLCPGEPGPALEIIQSLLA